ncbi:transposable element Tcb2 transposase [Trichonephila clavipes]|nr:transposable element Tcb2 transposase [Trichonephila clavipes]
MVKYKQKKQQVLIKLFPDFRFLSFVGRGSLVAMIPNSWPVCRHVLRSTFKDLRSPELNHIKHLWDILEQGVKGHHTTPTNLTELWRALANIWQVIPVERFQKLVESMPRRVAAVIKIRGGPTRY